MTKDSEFTYEVLDPISSRRIRDYFFLPRHHHRPLQLRTTAALIVVFDFVVVAVAALPLATAMIARFSRLWSFLFLLFFPRLSFPYHRSTGDRARVTAFLLFSRAATFHRANRVREGGLSPLLLAPATTTRPQREEERERQVCVFKVANCKLRFVARVHTQPPAARHHVRPLSYASAPDHCTGDLNEHKVREGRKRGVVASTRAAFSVLRVGYCAATRPPCGSRAAFWPCSYPLAPLVTGYP